ncbi:MAG TPA: cytochrome c biogenesis heme-transporting ATPase CcmA [Burkholderiales bacterium]|nr:cytochrome c biogenesis heme-transporting ATPase CcmA [Burkholderiales bacterium]
MLEAIGLGCVRGERTLFSGLDFALAAGELLRVAGANGSGKTSLLRIVCGLLAPSAGEVRWNGASARALREEYWRRLLYIGHANAIKDDLTAAENLAVACTLSGVRAEPARIGEALRRMGLAPYGSRPCKLLSQGQRRRVALARLHLATATPLWVLDEPFAALDATAVAEVEALIAGHVARGGIAIYTTHQEAHIGAAVAHTINLDEGARAC